MSLTASDQRSPQRRLQDEQIAAQPPHALPELPPNAEPVPVEEHLRRLRRRPQANLGVVENGVIRLVDGDVRLPERSQVIVVAPGTQ